MNKKAAVDAIKNKASLSLPLEDRSKIHRES
jgi:hypothetical protein